MYESVEVVEVSGYFYRRKKTGKRVWSHGELYIAETARQSGVELRPFKERGHRNSLRLAMIPAHSIPHTRTQFIVT